MLAQIFVSDGSFTPGCGVGVRHPGQPGVSPNSEERPESAVVGATTPAGVHHFFTRGRVRPAMGVALILIAPFVDRWSVDGGQRGKLRQLALIQLVCIL